MGNDMGSVVIIGLGHMHFVPGPGAAAFIAEVRVGIIGGVHTPAGWRQVVGLAAAEMLLLKGVGRWTSYERPGITAAGR